MGTSMASPYKISINLGGILTAMEILLVFSVAPFKIDQNKNQPVQ